MSAKGKVLVIDDDPLRAGTLAQLVSSAGFTTTVVTDVMLSLIHISEPTRPY